MNRLSLVTQCTNRKRLDGSGLCAAHVLEKVEAISAVDAWSKALTEAKHTRPVRELYCGRSFSEFLLTLKLLGDTPHRGFVVSAGLGLVEVALDVPGYDLTFTPAQDSSVVTVTGLSTVEWWRAINKSLKRPTFAGLLRQSPETLLVLILSSSYARVVQEDLVNISEKDLERVRLIGPPHANGLNEQARRVLVPYDHRFDDPKQKIRGTRTDFANRAGRHFVQEVLMPDLDGSIIEHKKKVRSLLNGFTAPRKKDNTRQTDEQVIEFIKQRWAKCEGKTSLLLRTFRQSGRACEQGRFAKLARSVREEMAREETA